MYGGGTSGDVPPPVLDGVICVGYIVVVFLWHASASLCGDSLPTLLLFHGAESELNALVADSLRRCATAKATAPPQSFAVVARCVLLCLIFSTLQSI